jgi:hypothetical protein
VSALIFPVVSHRFIAPLNVAKRRSGSNPAPLVLVIVNAIIVVGESASARITSSATMDDNDEYDDDDDDRKKIDVADFDIS